MVVTIHTSGFAVSILAAPIVANSRPYSSGFCVAGCGSAAIGDLTWLAATALNKFVDLERRAS